MTLSFPPEASEALGLRYCRAVYYSVSALMVNALAL